MKTIINLLAFLAGFGVTVLCGYWMLQGVAKTQERIEARHEALL